MAEIRKKGGCRLQERAGYPERYAYCTGDVRAEVSNLYRLTFTQPKPSDFQIVDGKLMPSLATIDGLGDKAADAVVDAAKQGKFLSKDDFRDRTKVSKTVIDLMDDLKLFGDIPQSNQMSLFDFTG